MIWYVVKMTDDMMKLLFCLMDMNVCIDIIIINILIQRSDYTE